MKLKTQNLGWLTAGFLAGFVVALLLSRIPTRRSVASTRETARTESLYDLAQPVTAAFTFTNVQLLEPIHITMPARANPFDPPNPWLPARPWSVDLIDNRYSPSDVQVEGLE